MEPRKEDLRELVNKTSNNNYYIQKSLNSDIQSTINNSHIRNELAAVRKEFESSERMFFDNTVLTAKHRMAARGDLVLASELGGEILRIGAKYVLDKKKSPFWVM